MRICKKQLQASDVYKQSHHAMMDDLDRCLIIKFCHVHGPLYASCSVSSCSSSYKNWDMSHKKKGLSNIHFMY